MVPSDVDFPLIRDLVLAQNTSAKGKAGVTRAAAWAATETPLDMAFVQQGCHHTWYVVRGTVLMCGRQYYSDVVVNRQQSIVYITIVLPSSIYHYSCCP
jgi:hypothetical protein